MEVPYEKSLKLRAQQQELYYKWKFYNGLQNYLNKEKNKRGIKMNILEDLKENKKLKDNWNKLKECLKELMNSCDADDKEFVETILDIMQELEKGDYNE